MRNMASNIKKTVSTPTSSFLFLICFTKKTEKTKKKLAPKEEVSWCDRTERTRHITKHMGGLQGSSPNVAGLLAESKSPGQAGTWLGFSHRKKKTRKQQNFE